VATVGIELEMRLGGNSGLLLASVVLSAYDKAFVIQNAQRLGCGMSRSSRKQKSGQKNSASVPRTFAPAQSIVPCRPSRARFRMRPVNGQALVSQSLRTRRNIGIDASALS
jgi:hypothetical protein